MLLKGELMEEGKEGKRAKTERDIEVGKGRNRGGMDVEVRERNLSTNPSSNLIVLQKVVHGVERGEDRRGNEGNRKRDRNGKREE